MPVMWRSYLNLGNPEPIIHHHRILNIGAERGDKHCPLHHLPVFYMSYHHKWNPTEPDYSVEMVRYVYNLPGPSEEHEKRLFRLNFPERLLVSYLVTFTHPVVSGWNTVL